MVKKVFLKYPCGKKFELKSPLMFMDELGKISSILPGDDRYFELAKEKFQINKLVVIQESLPDEKTQVEPKKFVSLINKIKSIH